MANFSPQLFSLDSSTSCQISCIQQSGSLTNQTSFLFVLKVSGLLEQDLKNLMRLEFLLSVNKFVNIDKSYSL